MVIFKRLDNIKFERYEGYKPHNILGLKWGERRGLNPQPLEPQSSALTS